MDFSKTDIVGKWVKLYNGIIMFVIEIMDDTIFLGTFIPCSSNAKKYKIKIDDIFEITDRETKKPVGCS